jgi:hypothetical protein
MSKHEFIEAPAKTEPLGWWRHFSAEELGPRDAAQIRRALRRVSIFGEPGWPDAIRGAAAEAIGVAIRVAVKQFCAEPVVDVAMSAVAAAAIDGDAAAREFVAHMLMKRAAFDAAAATLAKSWIAANRAAARAALCRGSPADAVAAKPPHALVRRLGSNEVSDVAVDVRAAG